MFKNKKSLFKAENSDTGTLFLYKKLSTGVWDKKTICWIDHNEIFFGKGVIKVKNIRELKEGNEESKKSYTIFVNANEKWNENVKKKHPIRWNLRLISRSSDFNYCFGIANTTSDGELLRLHFSKLGIPINTE